MNRRRAARNAGIIAAAFPYTLVAAGAGALLARKKMKKEAESRGAWTRAKRHVAKGHEEEKARLQHKGRAIGLSAASAIPIYQLVQMASGRGKKLPVWAYPAAAAAGMGIGHLAGERAALKRLELSQRRQDHGHYAPFPKTGGVLEQTAARTRKQIWATKRPLAKAVEHKPAVVKTPQPAPPQIEPSTLTPSMSPVMKTGALTAMKKLKVKAGEPEQTWRGQKVTRQKKGPENEPEPESWRGHDF